MWAVIVTALLAVAAVWQELRRASRIRRRRDEMRHVIGGIEPWWGRR